MELLEDMVLDNQNFYGITIVPRVKEAFANILGDDNY